MDAVVEWTNFKGRVKYPHSRHLNNECTHKSVQPSYGVRVRKALPPY